MTNCGVAPESVNVYVRTGSAPLVALSARGARSQKGLRHGSVAAVLPVDGSLTIAALVGPLAAGVVALRAVLVTDEGTVESDASLVVGGLWDSGAVPAASAVSLP